MSIDIAHYLKTLKLKPGALKRSSALAQLKPKLKDIYQKYYKGKEKSFIELLELIAAHNLLVVEQAITLLKKINPSGISTEKIRTIVERNNSTPKNITHFSDTEANSKKIIDIYAELLKEVSV
jgi:DNA-binding transcriptional regulator YbjK